MNIKVLFDGEYYSIKYLPRTYLPFWIFITTPFVILFFSILGFSILAKRFFVRLLNIKDKKIINSDFWQSNKEKMDVFILLSFSSFFVYAIFLNVAMLSGWRHFYFLHLFISYFAALSFNHYLNYFRKKIKTAYEYLLCVFIGFFLVYQNIKFHPYQSVYFNNFLKKVKKNKKYTLTIKDQIFLDSLRSDGIEIDEKFYDLFEQDISTIPTDIQVMVNNNEMGASLLRIIEVIGQDKLDRIDEDTIYFIIRTLNQLDIDQIRNKILLKVLPLKV